MALGAVVPVVSRAVPGELRFALWLLIKGVDTEAVDAIDESFGMAANGSWTPRATRLRLASDDSKPGRSY